MNPGVLGNKCWKRGFTKETQVSPLTHAWVETQYHTVCGGGDAGLRVGLIVEEGKEDEVSEVKITIILVDTNDAEEKKYQVQ